MEMETEMGIEMWMGRGRGGDMDPFCLFQLLMVVDDDEMDVPLIPYGIYLFVRVCER